MLIVFEGENETFMTTQLSAPPIEQSEQICKHHHQLLKLGFQFLGDLAFRKNDGITAYAYCQVKQSIYSLLYHSTGVEKVPCDLVSNFINGASLTTSTTPMSYGDLPALKIYRNSYPKAEITELHTLHQARVRSLELEQQGLRNAGTLEDLAASMDDYLSREPSDPLFMFLLYLKQWWYVLRGKYQA